MNILLMILGIVGFAIAVIAPIVAYEMVIKYIFRLRF